MAEYTFRKWEDVPPEVEGILGVKSGELEAGGFEFVQGRRGNGIWRRSHFHPEDGMNAEWTLVEVVQDGVDTNALVRRSHIEYGGRNKGVRIADLYAQASKPGEGMLFVEHLGSGREIIASADLYLSEGGVSVVRTNEGELVEHLSALNLPADVVNSQVTVQELAQRMLGELPDSYESVTDGLFLTEEV